MTRRAVAAATLVLLVGVGCGGSASTNAGSGSSPADTLGQATGVPWIVTLDSQWKTPNLAAPTNGPVALPTAKDSTAAAIAFLAQNRATFQMTDPASELKTMPSSANATESTSTIMWQEEVGTVPVYGAEWSATLTKDGKLSSFAGTYIPGLSTLSIVPKVTAAAAQKSVSGDAAGTPTLVICPFGSAGARLAWQVSVASGTANAKTIFVDALTGATLESLVSAIETTANGEGAKFYPPFNAGDDGKTFLVAQTNPGTYAMEAPTLSGTKIKVTSKKYGDMHAVTGASLSNWMDDIVPKGAAVDTMYTMEIAVRFFSQQFQRSSYDGSGGELVTVLNSGGPYWSGGPHQVGQINITDGLPSIKELPSGASMETIVHEMTHGVTMNAKGLVYDNGESGAIHEAISDIFAEFADHTFRPDEVKNYLYGDDVNLRGQAVRSLAHPRTDNVQFKGCDNMQNLGACGAPEPHYLSGVVSNAWYLMTHGGTNDFSHRGPWCGLGWDSSKRLWYAVETSTLQPTAKIKDVAMDTLTSAKALGIQVLPVACAWVGVGVLTDDEVKASPWNITCRDASDGGASSAASASDAGGSLVTAGGPLVCPGGILSQ